MAEALAIRIVKSLVLRKVKPRKARIAEVKLRNGGTGKFCVCTALCYLTGTPSSMEDIERVTFVQRCERHGDLCVMAKL